MTRLRLYYFYFYLLKKSKVKSFIKYKFHKFNNYLKYYLFYNSFRKQNYFQSLYQHNKFKNQFRPYKYPFGSYRSSKFNLNKLVKIKLWNQLHKNNKIGMINNLVTRKKFNYLFFSKLFAFIHKKIQKRYKFMVKHKIKSIYSLKSKKLKKLSKPKNNYFYRSFNRYKKKRKVAQFYKSYLRNFKKKYSKSNIFTRYNRLKSFFRRYYKFYFLSKYNYKMRVSKYQFKKRYRFWSIAFQKYNISLLNIIASTYLVRNHRNTYNFFLISTKLNKLTSNLALFLVRLQNSISLLSINNLKRSKLSKYISFFIFHYLRNTINSTIYNYKMQYQFKTYKNYPLNKHFKKMYLKHNFLKKLRFQSKIFNYLIAKNTIFIRFLKKLFSFYKLIDYKNNSKLYYKFNILIKYVINKWYPFFNSSKLAILHFLYKKYKVTQKLKISQFKKYYSMFCNYIRKVFKSYLFKTVHFKFYNRNIFITITNFKGNVKKKYSIGLIGYKKDKKKTYYASQELIKHIIPYIFRFTIFFKYERAIGTHLFNSKYFNFYWNLIRKKIGFFKKKKNIHNRYIIDIDHYYKRLFFNNLLHRLSKKIIVKIILKGTKYRMKGILNMFFKELYQYKKSNSFNIPLVLFFPLNNKPHNGCKYPKKKRKKRRRIAKKIRLRIKSKFLRRKMKKKKRNFYKRFRIKIKKSLYFVKRRVNPRNVSFFLKNKYKFRPYNYKRIHFMPDFRNYKYLTTERRFYYNKKRKSPSRYRFKYRSRSPLNQLGTRKPFVNSSFN